MFPALLGLEELLVDRASIGELGVGSLVDETILVLDEGRLVDQGTHAELSDRCAVYQEFLQTEQRREHLGY